MPGTSTGSRGGCVRQARIRYAVIILASSRRLRHYHAGHSTNHSSLTRTFYHGKNINLFLRRTRSYWLTVPWLTAAPICVRARYFSLGFPIAFPIIIFPISTQWYRFDERSIGGNANCREEISIARDTVGKSRCLREWSDFLWRI